MPSAGVCSDVNTILDSSTVSFVASGAEKARVISYVRRGEPVLLVGPTGCGKTTLLTEVAREIGTRFVPVTGGPTVSDAELLGGYLYRHEAMTWYDGPLVYAARTGLPFFFDEIGKTPEGTLRPLYSLLDDRREIHLLGKLDREPEVVRAAEGFCFMGAYTPRELGSLPEAFLQRCRVVRIGYLARDAEIALLVERTNVPVADATYLVDVALVLRNGASERKWRTPSTRALLLAARALTNGLEREWAVRESLFGPLELMERDMTAVMTTLDAKGLSFAKAPTIEPRAEADHGERVEPYELLDDAADTRSRDAADE